MAEIFLTVICIIIGFVALAVYVLVLWASAMSSASNASAVNNIPAFIALVVALAAFAGSALLLFF